MLKSAAPWVLLPLLIGCGPSEARTSIDPVMVLSASSVVEPLERVATAFAATNELPRVTVVSGASNALAQQILHGAPGDIFITANPKWAEQVRRAGLADRSHTLLKNRLVVVTPVDRSIGVASLRQLIEANSLRVAIASEGVPLGAYVHQALDRVDRDQWRTDGGAQFIRGSNARVTLAYAERGEVDAAIVYRSDAARSNEVQVACVIDESLHDPIVYHAVLLKGDASSGSAVVEDRTARFFRFLSSTTARQIFRNSGFELIAEQEGMARGAGSDGSARSTTADVPEVFAADSRPPRDAAQGCRWWSLTPDEWQSIGLSLWVAGVAVAVSLPFGVGFGWLFSRARFCGKSIVESIVYLPLVLPPVVTGYLLLVLFGRRGPLGHWLESTWGIHFVFDWKGAVLAAAIVSFPLMVRSIRTAFSSVDRRLEQAARTLGAGPFDVFLTISLPLARRGVIAGCVLAFARSLGEFGATIMIAGNIPGETRTIPLDVFNRLETPGGMESAAGIVIVSVLLATAALWIGNAMEPREQEVSG